MEDCDRAVLMGMNNPYGVDPHYALYPLPPRATGARIYAMLEGCEPGVSMTGYRDKFDRRNLVVGPWSAEKARANAARVLGELAGRTVLLFGKDVRRAFRVGLRDEPCGSVYDGSTWFNWAPHPSGLNHWYSNEENRRTVGEALARLYRGERGSLWADTGAAVQRAML